ncbi:MAG: ABC transporter C-terminal domain-containing protein [Thermodesulfobacteriota bacterium]
MRDELARVEAQVEQASAALDGIVGEMVDPAAYADGERWSELSRRHDEAKRRLERISAKWEELALKLEDLEAQANAQAET